MTEELTKTKKEASWEFRRDEQKNYLGIEDVWEEKLIKVHERLWLKEIKGEVIGFTHNTAKEMIDHIKKQCM